MFTISEYESLPITVEEIRSQARRFGVAEWGVRVATADRLVDYGTERANESDYSAAECAWSVAEIVLDVVLDGAES